MKKIYEANLYSLSQNIVVYRDWSKHQNIHENIKNGRIQFVRKITVQETMFKRYYREIITGRYIPINKKQTVWRYEQPFPKVEEEELKKVNYPILSNGSVFVNIDEYFDSNGIFLHKDLYEMNGKKLAEYLEQNDSNGSSFKEDLDKIFEQAQEFYSLAEEKNCFYDDKEMVRTLMKKARKQGIIKG